MEDQKQRIEELENKLKISEETVDRHLWNLRIQRMNHYDDVCNLKEELTRLKDSLEIQRKNEIADTILSSESFLWLMAGSNHIDGHLATIRPLYEDWIKSGGKTWGKQ